MSAGAIPQHMDSKLNATFYVNLLSTTLHASTVLFCTNEVGVANSLL